LNGHHKLPAGDQGFTIAESPHLFGDIYTANPFAPTVQSHTSISSSNIAFGHSENGHHHPQEEEQEALLDSSLWNSLFGEVTTKNPWATK
jgi:hypothetical protein